MHVINQVIAGGTTKMMLQFYTHTLAGITWLCIRDLHNPWYGETIKRLN